MDSEEDDEGDVVAPPAPAALTCLARLLALLTACPGRLLGEEPRSSACMPGIVDQLPATNCTVSESVVASHWGWVGSNGCVAATRPRRSCSG